MAKAIKLENDNYIDSSGVVHNREPLNEILNPVVLYESNGESTDINLNDDYNDYSYIEIYARESGNKILPIVKLPKESTGFAINSLRSDSGGIVIYSKKYNISSNKISISGSICVYEVNNTINYIRTDVDYWRISIIKVIGYK